MMATYTLTLKHPLTERIVVPFSLGVFEDCTLVLQRTEDDTWNGAVEYPEKISIYNEYPYIIPAETLESTSNAARFLFYPSSDMIGGVYDGEPTAVLEVTVSTQTDDTVTIRLELEQYLYWVSDPL
jgi:hypothetical protein